tara:strand:+ start:505 stop:612 length:108 start_codon:yes stop_codon:yes gene_type:complete
MYLVIPDLSILRLAASPTLPMEILADALNQGQESP